MKNYYFTFGTSETYPFKGGWIIVKAKNMSDAGVIFKTYFPNPENPNYCNCAETYPERIFKKTQMYKIGNFNSRCHGIIGFKSLKNWGDCNE